MLIKCLALGFVATTVTFALAQQQATAADRSGPGTISYNTEANLPAEKIGDDDLLGITVYDEPGLTRTVRVGSDGDVRLPMLQRHIHAAGLYPEELEKAISSELTDESILVDPVVTVSVVEYLSRPITVAGAVRNPLTFQAAGTITLLDAISRAGGVADNAGPDILISHPSSTVNNPADLTERISVRSLLSATGQVYNRKLEGGETIRVPEAGRIFVAGCVKKPGAYSITDSAESSVIKALALSEGLDTYSGHTAYIYRADGVGGHRNEIPIEIKKILARKSPDVPLFPNDMLYVPNSTGLRASAKALEIALGAGLGVASIAVLATR